MTVSGNGSQGQPPRDRCKALRGKRYLLLLGALAVWIAGVGVGFARLMDYATRPGERGAPAERWPAGTVVIPDPDRANLVVLAHPRCPCSRSTMDELESLLARCHDLVTTHVLFYRPGTAPDTWAKTDLWRRAAALPAVRVRADADGAQARLFGATTSGQVLLYDRHGRLLFSGGVTNTRGHASTSIGTEALWSLLTTGAAAQTETPVYGCPLAGPESGSPREAPRPSEERGEGSSISPGDQPCRK